MKLLSRLALVALLLLVLLSTSVVFGQDVEISEVTDEAVFPTNTITATPTTVVIELTEEATEVALPLPEPTPTYVPDEDPAPLPVLPDVDPESAGELLIRSVYAIVGVLISSPLVTTIVGVLKKIPALKGFSSSTLAFVIACVVWVVIAIGDVLGIRPQLESIALFIQTGLPNLLGVIGTLFCSSIFYEFAVRQQLPVAGNQRAQYTEGREQVVSPIPVSQRLIVTETFRDTVPTEAGFSRSVFDPDKLAQEIGERLMPEIERIVDARIAARAQGEAGG